MTVLLQIGNYDNRESSPNLMFLPYKLELKGTKELIEQPVDEKGPTKIAKDRVRMRDEIAGIFITRELDFSLFEYFYSKMEESESMLVCETIYRAVSAKNVESRFFQLFTIIEAIETKYGTDEEISHKILPPEELERFSIKLEANINELGIDDTYRTRLKSRMLQILKGATIETRAEKLADIITRKYNIIEVKKGMVTYQINFQKMKEFIEIRNRLFHGNHPNGESYNVLVQKTNELQELCLEIAKRKTV